jgi:hypothetical protein
VGQNHLTLRMTVSKLPSGLYRTELESGPSGRRACEFSIPEETLATWRDLHAIRDAGAFGSELFARTVSGPAREAFSQWQGAGHIVKRDVDGRICLRIATPDLFDVPWECFHHDGSHFIKQGWSVVRVLVDIPSKPAFLGPIRRLLIVTANPTEDINFDSFDASGHLQELESILRGKVSFEVLPNATIETLRAKLQAQERASDSFDSIYFVGHGDFRTGPGGQLILEDEAPLIIASRPIRQNWWTAVFPDRNTRSPTSAPARSS